MPVSYAIPELLNANQTLHTMPIDVNQESSVSFWTEKLGCSELELRVAIAEVGDRAVDVGDTLGRPL
jgi:hypothetical protein